MTRTLTTPVLAPAPSPSHRHLATQVTIEYCEIGHYLRPARDLLTAVRSEFPGAILDLDLVPSSGGVFEVSVDDRLIFSKKATRRLPDKDEIFYHVVAAISPAVERPCVSRR